MENLRYNRQVAKDFSQQEYLEDGVINMFSTTLRGRQFTFYTKSGLFSKDAIDKGSLLLIDHTEIKSTDTVLDFGCGYGSIGLVAATLAYEGKVYMVDTDIRAIKYSNINTKENKIHNVEIIASDGFEEMPKDISFDVIVSNPPSHSPKETIIEFLKEAKIRLKKTGKIYFVTERRIKPMIKREFENVFGNYEVIATNFHYVVSRAVNV